MILEFDLDMVKLYHHTKTNVSMSTIAQLVTDTQIDKHTDRARHTVYENSTDTILVSKSLVVE